MSWALSGAPGDMRQRVQQKTESIRSEFASIPVVEHTLDRIAVTQRVESLLRVNDDAGTPIRLVRKASQHAFLLQPVELLLDRLFRRAAPRDQGGLSDAFAADVAQGVDFFSRYKHGTTLFDADGTRLDLPTLLPRRARQPLDLAIQLGQQRLPCRLLALPVPATVAAERRRRLRYQAKRKQRPVSRIALVLADWNLYVTSLSAAQLALAEAPILARTRWQIERLFKLWKSNGLLDEWRSRDPWRVWCELYGKLLALLFQHWLSVVSCWHFLDRSLHRAAQVIGNEAFHLLAHLGQRSALIAALHHLQTILAHTCHLSKRAAQPRTFQLWIEAQLA